MDEEFGSLDELSDVFHRATGYVTEKASGLLQPDLLYLYGRYKQALVGPCNEIMPSFFSFGKRSKWDAWHNLGEMSQEEAMKEYIGKLTAINPDWDAKSEHSKNVFGPAVSTFLKTDPELADESKTPFDWVKEGNVEQLRQFLSINKSAISCQDEQGLSLLHWASDRGYVEIVSVLLSYGIDIDCQDDDGQTALHYACSCGHEALVEFLLKKGASPKLPDTEGLLPCDVALTPTIKKLFLTAVTE